MAGLRRSVSSLSALSTFEAAARLQGFTRAADELGVTQAAVSRQIKLLEAELNTPLFVRGHRRVDLTPAGVTLSNALTGAFDQVSEALDTIRRPMEAKTVTLGATLAFMHFWLLPRLPEFRAAHPDIQLRLVSQDTGFDLRRDPVDVLIFYGTPPVDGAKLVAALEDQVYAVACPGFAKAPVQFETLPLIGCEWVEPTWLSWRRWAQMAGVGPLTKAKSLRFSHYADAIYAAMAGEGAALGWQSLVAPLVAQGRLERLSPHIVTPAERHTLLIPSSRAQSKAARALTEWLKAAMTAEQAETGPMA